MSDAAPQSPAPPEGRLDNRDRVDRCRACVVRQTALFVNLTPEELDDIAPAVPSLRFAPGETLYWEGDWPNALFIVRRGLIKQELSLADGSYRIVRLARRADLLAMESLLETACDHTAVALTEVDVCRVPLPIVRLVMNDRDWMATQMIRHWHHALKRADDWLRHYSTGGGRERMARFLVDLLDLSQVDRREGCAPLDAPRETIELPSRDDIGAILGITKETASRLISDFRRVGLVKDATGRRIALDRPGLVALLAED